MVLIVAAVALLLRLGGGADATPTPAAEPLVNSVERLVAQAETDLVLERTERGETSWMKVWKPRDAAVHKEGEPRATERSAYAEVRLFLLPSAAAAQSALAKSVSLTPVSPSGSVEGLGDESYVWSSYAARGSVSIRFRRSNAMILVSASTEELASRFAFHVLAAIDERLAETKEGVVKN